MILTQSDAITAFLCIRITDYSCFAVACKETWLVVVMHAHWELLICKKQSIIFMASGA